MTAEKNAGMDPKRRTCGKEAAAMRGTRGRAEIRGTQRGERGMWVSDLEVGDWGAMLGLLVGQVYTKGLQDQCVSE